MRAPLIRILLGAFALRLAYLTFQPLWFDEGWSVWFATADLPTLAARTAADIHPPFYYALLHGWVALAGTSEFALRLLSVQIGVLTVAALYALARALLGERAGAWVGVLAALSPLYVFYAQEIRMYGLVTLLGIVSSWLFWEATADSGRRTALWAAYVLVTSAAMYTQYYGAFIPLFHFAFWIYTLRAAPHAPRFSLRAPRVLFPLISFLSLFMLYLPWLLYVTSQLTTYVANKIGEEKYAPLNPLDYAVRHLSAFAVGHLPSEWAWLGWVALLFVALAVWGLKSPVFSLQSQPATIFLSLYLFIPFLAAYLVQLRFPFAPPRMERLLLLASPPFLMLVANGIARVRGGLSNLQSPISNLQFLGVSAVITLTSAFSLVSFYTTSRYPEQDYRPVAARINALALPSDVVVLVHPWQVGFMQAYLQVPVSLQMVADPAWGAADEAQLSAALAANRRVWLPAYHALGALLETAMEQYLAQHALPVEAKWHETTLLSFYAPTLKSGGVPSFVPLATGRVAVVSTQSHAYTAGWDVVPLRILLFSSATQGVPPAMSVRLKDGRGRIWASQDRQFARADDSSYGDPLFTDAFGLLIPAGTPQGSYNLSIALYDATTQQPLDAETSIYSLNVFAPDTPPPIAALPIGTPLVADWLDVRLLGCTLRDGAWQAGDTLHLDLFWQAQQTAPGARTLFVQLQDAQGKVVALDEAAPSYPSAQWHRGDLLREQRDLPLPATLAAGTYRLVVGWLDADARTRLRQTNGADQLTVREVAVSARPHRFEPPAPQTPTTIRFADVATLVGYDLERDSANLRLRLHWQAQREVETAYKVFVHLVAPDGKTIVAQHDSPPANGALPTTSWVRGEYIADEHALTLPASLPSGAYRVRVGLYDPQSGARVKAFAADGGAFPDDAAELLQFELTYP